jgi:hypothetical protein
MKIININFSPYNEYLVFYGATMCHSATFVACIKPGTTGHRAAETIQACYNEEHSRIGTFGIQYAGFVETLL